MFKNRNKIKKFVEFHETDKIRDIDISFNLKSVLFSIANNTECIVGDFKFLSKKYLKQNNIYNYSLLKSVSEFMIKSGFLMKDYDQFPYTKNTNLNSIKFTSKKSRILLQEYFDKYDVKIKDLLKIKPSELNNIKNLNSSEIKEILKIVRKSGIKW